MQRSIKAGKVDKVAGKNAAGIERRRVQMGDSGSNADEMGDLLLAGGCPRFPGFTFDKSGGRPQEMPKPKMPTEALPTIAAELAPEAAAAAAAEEAAADDFSFDATKG